MEAWSKVEIASLEGHSHLGWVPAREPGRQTRFDREVEVESFLCLLHAVAASTEEEKQKLEGCRLQKLCIFKMKNKNRDRILIKALL